MCIAHIQIRWSTILLVSKSRALCHRIFNPYIEFPVSKLCFIRESDANNNMHE